MRLYLINPSNPLVAFIKANESRWNQYRVWKPLSLLVLAGLTPDNWDITVIDENLGIPDYESMPRPDLVGITAFTSQANRAYRVAALFRDKGIPVVMGGIHATMCLEEASTRVDAVVTGEAESAWKQVLTDVEHGTLQSVYAGQQLDMGEIPIARHDLLPTGYLFGSIQTTRGCPLACNFCSVTPFNGGKYRHRPIPDIIEELRQIKEKYILFVDDNLCGTRKDHIERTKELFHAMIAAGLRKKFTAQVTINMGDDDELLRLAAKAGCFGVFIGFEASTPEGLTEVHKKFNIQHGRNLADSVRRIQRHGIIVAGSFIMGLDVDRPGIGRQIATTAHEYGLDTLNVMFLTPLPGTQLWHTMEAENRIAANTFPEDWQYYTLTYPVAHYKHLSWSDLVEENHICSQNFYSYPRILRRLLGNMLTLRRPLLTLIGNLSNRTNGLRFQRKVSQALNMSRGEFRQTPQPLKAVAAESSAA